MKRIVAFLVVSLCCSVSLGQCENGQCKMPVRKAVKAVASVPVAIIRQAAPVQRVASVVRMQPARSTVRFVTRRRPLMSFLSRVRSRLFR